MKRASLGWNKSTRNAAGGDLTGSAVSNHFEGAMIVSERNSSQALIPIEEPVFSEEKGPDSEFKYRYRLNLNPGTTRHLLESTHPITIANVPATQ
jgi:hypothetical protein